MSYLRKIEYKIVPLDSYKIIRNCSGCNRKNSYINTGNFRVNANGNRIDVWLIYQCEECRHTYNLSVLERVRPSEISSELYQRFLANDEELALVYGMNKALFSKNKAQIDWENVSYQILPVCDTASEDKEEMDCKKQIVLYNPYDLKVRDDKVAAEILKISRSKVKRLLEEGMVEIIIQKECE